MARQPAFDLLDPRQPLDECQLRIGKLDNRLDRVERGQFLLNAEHVGDDPAAGREEVERVDLGLHPPEPQQRDRRDTRERRGHQLVPGQQPARQPGEEQPFLGLVFSRPRRQDGEDRRGDEQSRRHGHHRPQGGGVAKLRDRDDVGDADGKQPDSGRHQGDQAGAPTQRQRAPQAVGRVPRFAEVVNHMDRGFQGEDHHHDRQRAEDEVHLAAAQFENRQRDVDRPDGQRHHRQ